MDARTDEQALASLSGHALLGQAHSPSGLRTRVPELTAPLVGQSEAVEDAPRAAGVAQIGGAGSSLEAQFEAVAQQPPPPPPALAEDETATLAYADAAFEREMRAVECKTTRKNLRQANAKNADKLADLALQANAARLWITKLGGGFSHHKVQGVCGFPGCRELSVPKLSDALKRKKERAPGLLRCKDCPSDSKRGAHLTVTGRAAAGTSRGGPAFHTKDSAARALEQRLDALAAHLGVQVQDVAVGEVGKQYKSRAALLIGATVVTLPCSSTDVEGCNKTVAHQIDWWMTADQGADVLCDFCSFYHGARADIARLMSDKPGTTAMLPEGVELVELRRVARLPGGTPVPNANRSVWRAACHNQRVRPGSCSRLAQANGWTFKILDRTPLCEGCQFLWCDLADSTGTRRLFATDPKSSLEPIVTEGQLERSLAHLVHSQPNLFVQMEGRIWHIPDGIVFNDVEGILQVELPPRADGTVLAVEEFLRFEGRDSRRFHLTNANADAFWALGLVDRCWDAKSTYWLVAGSPDKRMVGVGTKMEATARLTDAPYELWLYDANVFLETISTGQHDWRARLQARYDQAVAQHSLACYKPLFGIVHPARGGRGEGGGGGGGGGGDLDLEGLDLDLEFGLDFELDEYVGEAGAAGAPAPAAAAAQQAQQQQQQQAPLSPAKKRRQRRQRAEAAKGPGQAAPASPNPRPQSRQRQE